MTIGAFSSPDLTISLKARPARCRSPRPIQQMRAGRPWKAMRSPAMSSQRCRCASSGNSSFILASVLRMSSGSPRQRHPAERPLAAAEQRPDVGRHEAGEVEGVLHAVVEGHLADVVAVVDGRDAHGLEVEHRLHVHRAALRGGVAQRGMLAGIGLRGLPALDAPAGRQVAVDQVVRAGLVGHQVGLDAARLGALHQLGQQLGRVAEQADRHRLAFGRVLRDARQRVVEVVGLLVEVAACAGGSRCGSAGTRCSASRRRRRWRPAAARRPCRPGRR